MLAKCIVVCLLAGWSVFRFLRKLFYFAIVQFQILSRNVCLEDGCPLYAVYQMHSSKCKVACRHSNKFCGFSSDSVILVLLASYYLPRD